MATYKAKSLVMPNGDEFVPDENVFVAEYGVTTYAEMLAAKTAGKEVLCVYNDAPNASYYSVGYFDDEDQLFLFVAPNATGEYIIYVRCNQNGWTSGYNKAEAYPYNSVALIPTSSYYLTMSTSGGKLGRSNIQFGSSTTKYLSNKGTWENVPTVPTNVSSLNNDAGYLTLSTLPIYNGGVS